MPTPAGVLLRLASTASSATWVRASVPWGLGAAAALGGRIESAFWFVAVAMSLSGAALYRWGEEPHPRLNPAQ